MGCLSPMDARSDLHGHMPPPSGGPEAMGPGIISASLRVLICRVGRSLAPWAAAGWDEVMGRPARNAGG